MTYKILIVDDDAVHRCFMEAVIKQKLGYDYVSFSGGQEAIDYLSSAEGRDVDLVLQDIIMPRITGLQVLETITAKRPGLPFIIVTASNDLTIAIKAMKMGAADFIFKHENEERVITSIQHALERSKLSGEVSRLKRSLEGQTTFDDIIGTASEAMKKAVGIAKKAANSDIAVIIRGESGVGKELFARAIHGCSERAEKPFIAVNCGAIPENLVESTLFGHEKGSFTGATYKNIGKFREANGGTLFLDEIGELKPDVQSKLLRVLQNGEIEPVGSSKSIHVDVRLISATHRDLKAGIKNGTFREDLYYRLNVFPINVPPLRDRGTDVDALINHFVSLISIREGRRILGISDAAGALLRSFEWPGNIRQLENAIFRATVMCDDGLLEVKNFSFLEEAPKRKAAEIAPVNGPSALPYSMAVIGNNNQFRSMNEIEKEVIIKALDFYKWRISEVARRLGIGRSTLYRKMEEFGIKHPETGDAPGSDKKIAAI